jgi:SAM-dependent methyltransferase
MNALDPSPLAPLAQRWPEYWERHRRRFADTMGFLLRHCRPAGGTQLLDIGVFPGFLAALARHAGFAVSGLANEEMTPEFRSLAAERGIAVGACDIERDPFPFDADQFDAALFTETIEHLHRDPYHPLAEAYRVLKPGGLLLVTTPNLGRWAVIHGLLRGRSFYPPLEGDLHESFPVNPNYKHCREYTARELGYLLCEQDKRLYRYRRVATRFSRCWDPAFGDVLRAARHPLAFPACGLDWLLPALLPRLRANLMIAARKPRFAEFIPSRAYEQVSGFHEIERDAELDSPHRRPFDTPFRWTNGRAAFTVHRPRAEGVRDLHFRLQAGCLAPPQVGPLPVELSVNGRPALQLRLAPSKAYTTLDVPLPPALRGSDRLRFGIASATWSPARFGLPDARELGILVSWGDSLLYAPEDARA